MNGLKKWTISMMGYSASKEKSFLQYVTTWMKLEDIMLNEISQAQKDKYGMLLLGCGI